MVYSSEASFLSGDAEGFVSRSAYLNSKECSSSKPRLLQGKSGPKANTLDSQHPGSKIATSRYVGQYIAPEPSVEDCFMQFGNGESLNDVAARAKRFVDAVIRPWLFLATEKDLHVAIVAHGIVRLFLLLVGGISLLSISSSTPERASSSCSARSAS